MNRKSDEHNKIHLGVKFIIGFHILNLLLFLVGQGGAVISYDTVAEWGLQEIRDTVDPVIVLVNMGIALADVIVGVPLFILAITGLWRQRYWGCVCSWMVFAISLYWTTVAWSKQYFYTQASIKCEPFTIDVHLVLAFVFLFSAWGSWYLYKKRQWFG
ncbi:hypothetical protein OU798_18305 [Prolixibacteraceae bacterium Z1-6]|uniref:Uncharacterized protein n=1 Tax=Draconibacterium aestuarii TaxID=2998507 RepID=A0A9X3F9T4_9BACT|nr:hypothetical protein [Prolixibacteraceae bacterium Z1-6]